MNKKIKIGFENFKNYIERDYYYVDKTNFVRDLITDHQIVNLITRPRRFGKTLGLSMLKCFFEIDETRENEKLFTGLNITQYPEYTEHLGKYPVIYLSFKGARLLTLEQSIGHICTLISDEFFRHKEAVDAYKARRSQVDAILNYSDDIALYYDAVKLLSKILYEFYKRPVIILIDEYDVPLEHSYFNGFYEGMLTFIRSLFESALKTNEVLEFAVLTGCLRISKESVFTGLNNFTTYTTLQNKYSQYFGFTEAEVRQIIKDYGLADDVFGNIKEWYDGYHFGNTEIYNPWSVLQAIASVLNGEADYIKPYWSNTSSNTIVKSLLEHADYSVKEDIEELLRGGAVLKPIIEDITFGDIRGKKDSLWAFLYYTGYLTAKGYERKKGTLLVNLKLPNQEVRYIYENQIQDWIDNIISSTKLEVLYKAILDGDVVVLTEEINKILLQTISYNDYRETFYHGLMMGLLTGLPEYFVKSNAESGEGRSDVILKHASGSGKAMIFEFKIAENGTMMEKKSQDAINQIEALKYDAVLLHEGYDDIMKYGIAFNKKRCFVSVGKGMGAR